MAKNSQRNLADNTLGYAREQLAGGTNPTPESLPALASYILQLRELITHYEQILSQQHSIVNRLIILPENLPAEPANNSPALLAQFDNELHRLALHLQRHRELTSIFAELI